MSAGCQIDTLRHKLYTRPAFSSLPDEKAASREGKPLFSFLLKQLSKWKYFNPFSSPMVARVKGTPGNPHAPFIQASPPFSIKLVVHNRFPKDGYLLDSEQAKCQSVRPRFQPTKCQELGGYDDMIFQ